MAIDALDVLDFKDDPKQVIDEKVKDMARADGAIWRDWKYLMGLIKKADPANEKKHTDYASKLVDQNDIDRADLKEPTYDDFSNSIGNLDEDRDYFADHIHEKDLKTVPDKSSNLYAPNQDNGTYYPVRTLTKQTYTGDPKKLDEFYRELVDMPSFGDYAVIKAGKNGVYWDGKSKTYDPDNLADLKHATYQSVLSMADVQILDEADNFNYDHDTNVASN